jgi:hypothetical protein
LTGETVKSTLLNALLKINHASYQTVATFSQKPKIRALLEPQLLKKEVGVLAILFFK